MNKYLLSGIFTLCLAASFFFSSSPNMVGAPAGGIPLGDKQSQVNKPPPDPPGQTAIGKSPRKPASYTATAKKRGPTSDSAGVFVVVDTRIPEHLYVYRGTSVILATYCNTGRSETRTPTGVFRIFAKKPSDTMAGTNPDGSKYYDPGVPWVMYFYRGCAIHGFSRARYGFPQSLGCVELPVTMAKKVYYLLPVGAKVDIK